MLTLIVLILTSVIAGCPAQAQEPAPSFPVVDTGQSWCYDASGTPTPCPASGESLFGQDANYQGIPPTYRDNGNGTITDLNTGLMWQKSPGSKVTWEAAMSGTASLNLAGYNDWRVPTIKELYSLINFNGVTGMAEDDSIPYLDTAYFDFSYGDTSAGERMIDAQYWSSTEYVSTTMTGNPTTFGVNFADGRIKGYGRVHPDGRQMTMFVRYVRGDTGYGVNSFVDNSNGTITDQTTGLMWMQDDSGAFNVSPRGDGSLIWEEALSFCETLDYAGYNDWRLPNAKELQSIVDYTRSPDTTNSAAIDPAFHVTVILDDMEQTNYPYFWTSTTHLDGMRPGDRAVYVAFGEAQGYMQGPNSGGQYQLMDVHGAGAQRSDMKTGDPSQLPIGMGPQGDVQVIYNYARCARGGAAQIFSGGEPDVRSEVQPQDGPPPQDGQMNGQPGQPPQGGQPGGQSGQPGQPPQGGQPGGQPGQPGQPPPPGQN
jgi:hypothetical protein